LTDDDIALLSYRLYRYRREFSRLMAARNTTKSRFVRLFVICLIVIAVCLPYTAWLVADVLKVINGPYSWSRVHNPEIFHRIIKVPMFGHVAPDKWGQVATGYVVIFVFGTGSDAHNTYKKMLLALGLGRFFPSLYIMRESGASMPSSFINARTWTFSISSKAKGMFGSRTDSVADTLGNSTRHNSMAMGSMHKMKPLATKQNATSSFFNCILGRQKHETPALPLYVDYRSRSVFEMANTSTRVRDLSPGSSAHAWAADKSTPEQKDESDGVRVFREVRLEHE
jgi:pheromone a factor receptor